MRRDQPGIEQAHPEALEEGHQRRHRVIGNVLVIDRVEQQVRQHVDQVRDFEHEHAFVSQQAMNAVDETRQIRCVRKDIVRAHQCGRAMFAPQVVGEVRREEGLQRRNTLLDSGRGNLLRRVDAKHVAHAVIHELAQQRSIVGADLDDERCRAQSKARDRVVGVIAKMRDEDAGCSRNVDVVTEESSRIDDLGQLQVAARSAEQQRQWNRWLWPGEIMLANEVVGQRGRGQREGGRQRIPACGAQGTLFPPLDDATQGEPAIWISHPCSPF